MYIYIYIMVYVCIFVCAGSLGRRLFRPSRQRACYRDTSRENVVIRRQVRESAQRALALGEGRG